MNLLVLGNGFDLASGLPTSYTDFFKERNSQLSMIFEKIDDILVYTHQSNLDVVFEELKKCNKLVLNGHEIFERHSKAYESLYKQLQIDADTIINNYRRLIDETINTEDSQLNFNFWDFYFYSISLNEKNLEWNNVENEIFKLVSTKYKDFIENDTEFNSKLNSLRLIGELEANNWDSTVLELIDRETKRNFIIFLLFFEEELSLETSDIHKILLQELIMFEENFKEYIHNVTARTVNYKAHNGIIYTSNLARLINSERSDKHFLINFNYTTFPRNINSFEDMDNSNNAITIELLDDEKNKNITIENVNVHGNFNEVIIFGIDQQEVGTNQPHYIFTKTYRKILESDKFKSNKIPRIEDLKEISFYGHSLSEADYSYFQTVFDFYRIYESEIMINFYYSLYGENDCSKNINKNVFVSSVFKLIEKYGSTMNNVNHGKNLVHKLLLENRLNVTQCDLKTIPET